MFTHADLYQILRKNDKGGVKQCISNVVLILENDPLFAEKFRFNELTDRVDIVGKMSWNREGTMITDTDINFIKMYLDDHYSLNTEKDILSGIDIVASKQKFHPIRDYLNSLEWDGEERVRYALHRFLGANTSDITYESLKTFMLGAVERVFNPGCKFEMMLCLVGGQGVGKSTFFRFLAIKDDWYSDDIRKLDDENVYRRLQGHWIMEMSEMIATSSAKSIEEIKAFLTKTKDVYKVPYEKFAKDRQRQCVFGGTSNKKQFLPGDRTGNRRFLPVLCHGEDAEVHILTDEDASREYINQMWAEIMEIYKSGEYSLCLTKELQGQMNKYQQEFIPEDSDEAAILGWLDETKEEYVCSRMLFYEALDHSTLVKPQKWETNAINEIMTVSATDWELGPQHRFDKYGQQRSWVRRNRQLPDENVNDGFVPVPEYMQEELPF